MGYFMLQLLSLNFYFAASATRIVNGFVRSHWPILGFWNLFNKLAVKCF